MEFQEEAFDVNDDEDPSGKGKLWYHNFTHLPALQPYVPYVAMKTAELMV